MESRAISRMDMRFQTSLELCPLGLPDMLTITQLLWGGSSGTLEALLSVGRTSLQSAPAQEYMGPLFAGHYSTKALDEVFGP